MPPRPIPSLGDRHPLRALATHVTHHPGGLGIYWRLLAVLARHPPDPSAATVADADASQQPHIFQLAHGAVESGAICCQLVSQVSYVRPMAWEQLLQLHQHQHQLGAAPLTQLRKERRLDHAHLPSTY